MSHPEISVIMPAFNAEVYIQDAVQSILNQTFSNFELLIFDDASTDRTFDILSQFNDARIKLYRSDNNCGYLEHLNRGIEMARGKYIARMDSDDISNPDRFYKQWVYMEAHAEVGLLGSGFKKIGMINKEVHLPLSHEELKIKLLHINPFCHSSVMFRLDVLKGHNLKYPTKFYSSEDYWLWSKFAEVSRIANLPDILVKYRVHDRSISQQKKDLQQQLARQIQRDILQRFLKLEPDNLNTELYTKMLSHQQLNEYEVIKLGIWFHKLLTVNKRVKSLDEVLFKRFLTGKWRDIFFKELDSFKELKSLKKLHFFKELPAKDKMKIQLRFYKRFVKW